MRLNKSIYFSGVMILLLIMQFNIILNGQTPQSIAIDGLVTVNSGQTTDYTVISAGLTTGCLNYQWTVSGGGNIMGSSTMSTVNIQWTTSGSVTVNVVSLAAVPGDPILEGSNPCEQFSESANLSVTVNSVSLCNPEININLNCAVGVIQATLDLSTYSWSDGLSSQTKLVKDGDVISFIKNSGICSGQTFSYTISEYELLQNCAKCRESYLNVCISL